MRMIDGNFCWNKERVALLIVGMDSRSNLKIKFFKLSVTPKDVIYTTMEFSW